ncbi:MAG: dicarboxylate/amino acid:cation symporter [Spirochaetales bacterium]|nr:dicarboxylate/amino acid:cation symporter [Spirochaetales bacterium]
MKISSKILIFIILGFILGLFIPYLPVLYKICQTIEQIFIRMLTFIVKPYIFISIIIAFSSLKDTGKTGKIFPLFFLFTFLSGLIATIQAIVFSILVKPGYQIDLFDTKTPALLEFNSIFDTIVNYIPKSFSDLFSTNIYQIFPTFLIAMFVGIAIYYAVKRGEVFLNLSKSIEEILDYINLYLIEIFAFSTFFIGFGLANTIKQTANFIFIVKPLIVMLFSLVFQVYLIPFFIIYFWLKKNPAHYFKSVLGAQISGFATGSVVTNYQNIIFHTEKNLGINRTISSIYSSLGLIFNIDGIAITSIIGFFYILQIQQVSLSFLEILPLFLGMLLLFFVKDGFAYPEFPAVVLFLSISETLPLDMRALFAAGLFIFARISSFITSSSIIFINYFISEKYLHAAFIQDYKDQI